MTQKKPRLGRPPATDSTETKRRILLAARQQFGAFGFESTSNRMLAEHAGLTTGAIYHYFDSKIDIYAATYEQVQIEVYDRFEASVNHDDCFVEQLVSVLEEAHVINTEDPSLAMFIGSARVDVARDLALAARIDAAQPARRRNFFEGIVDRGVETGELRAEDREKMMATIRTFTVGLTDAVSNDPKMHRDAVDGLRALLEGQLVSKSTKS